MPPGVLHAPGSLCTYEPQKASDVFAMYQSLAGDQIVPNELLWKNTPQDKLDDLDYLISVLDWDLNVDPDFIEHRIMRPKPVRPPRRNSCQLYHPLLPWTSSDRLSEQGFSLPLCPLSLIPLGAALMPSSQQARWALISAEHLAFGN